MVPRDSVSLQKVLVSVAIRKGGPFTLVFLKDKIGEALNRSP